ncbi:MAG: hypothetical protein P4M07_00525, partial [Xanthobacteraceae bacterium]|nr:hypothetical protein [Xanthobacteraceae bacterium]
AAKNQASWYCSSWRGLQSDASTPDDSRLITPETTPPSIPTNSATAPLARVFVDVFGVPLFYQRTVASASDRQSGLMVKCGDKFVSTAASVPSVRCIDDSFVVPRTGKDRCMQVGSISIERHGVVSSIFTKVPTAGRLENKTIDPACD